MNFAKYIMEFQSISLINFELHINFYFNFHKKDVPQPHPHRPARPNRVPAQRHSHLLTQKGAVLAQGPRTRLPEIER